VPSDPGAATFTRRAFPLGSRGRPGCCLSDGIRKCFASGSSEDGGRPQVPRLCARGCPAALPNIGFALVSVCVHVCFCTTVAGSLRLPSPHMARFTKVLAPEVHLIEFFSPVPPPRSLLQLRAARLTASTALASPGAAARAVVLRAFLHRSDDLTLEPMQAASWRCEGFDCLCRPTRQQHQSF